MRILYVVNNAAFFCSHRLAIALAARDAGHEVRLLTGQAGSITLEGPALVELRQAGIDHVITRFRSGGLSPIGECLGFLAILATMLKWRPDVVHCVSPKGVLYGGIAARITGAPGVVLAVSGMGSVFTGRNTGIKALLRSGYRLLAKAAYGHPHKRVIVQNTDDYRSIVDSGLASRDQVHLIPGSGVELARYVSIPLDSRQELVVLPARMLKDKGVVEFVEAARTLRAEGCRWRFALVGTADYDNPSAIAESQILEWVREGLVEWWGHQTDMVSVYSQARVVCLPSYREGMPKALLEAAAAGCAVVTTDTIGCRDAIEPGSTGDLVTVADSNSLAGALRNLINDPVRRVAYGKAGRQMALRRFGIDQVIMTTLSVYGDLSRRS